jgi:transcriptional regulator with XRE-family HTH domain
LTGDEAKNVSSRRLTRIGGLAKQLHDDGFRNSYLSRQLKAFLAAQIRALRGEKTQTAFGKDLGKPQSVVSRLENERLSGLHIQTLIDIAQKLKIGVIIRFVEFSEFLRYTEDYSAEALSPPAYDQQKIDNLARRFDDVCPIAPLMMGQSINALKQNHPYPNQTLEQHLFTSNQKIPILSTNLQPAFPNMPWGQDPHHNEILAGYQPGQQRRGHGI